MSTKIDRLAQVIWDYHHMNHELEKCDCIVVLGSQDTRVAERGAQAYLEGWAPLLVFSGGLGNLTEGIWDEPEADKFARIAIEMGVPKDRILIENRSKNTGENVIFTRKFLAARHIEPKRIIVVQKPYMERRAFATVRNFWPEVQCVVTSPQMSFRDYPNEEITKNDVINIMVGDLQRMKIYPEKGFQIPQEIPKNVWNAYRNLVQLGYVRHLVPE